MLRWIPSVLLLVSCGGESTTSAPSGRSLYFSKGCTACHGPEQQGSFMGPPLADLDRHWKRDELAKFIADPTGFAERDERLKKIASGYRTPMRPTPLTNSERESLVDYLLAKP